MRVHVQNPPGEALFAITPARWDAALRRHGSPNHGGDHVVTFADDDAGFAAAIRDAEILVTWTKQVRARLIGADLRALAPRLRAVSCTSAGLDRLAPFDWLPDGVHLLNNRGAHAAKAGEFALMALLMLAAGMPRFAASQRAERWEPRFGSVLAGRRLAVIGLGTIGAAAARHARAHGMHVTGVRTRAEPHPDCDEVRATADLDAVLPQAEFLALCCPLTDATRGLLDRRRLSLLPPGAKVLNMARGAVWEQEAACDLLDSGHLDGCVTDVAVPEPLPPGHRHWRTPGMTVVPHVSSDDPATYNDRTLDILLANLDAIRDGRPPPNRVDPTRGY